MLAGSLVRWMKLLLASLWPCALTIAVCFVRTVPDVAPGNHRRKMRRNIVRQVATPDFHLWLRGSGREYHEQEHGARHLEHADGQVLHSQ